MGMVTWNVHSFIFKSILLSYNFKKMHPFQEYSSMSFDKYIQPNNQRYNEGYLPHLNEWVPSPEFPPLHVHTLYNQFPTPTNHQSAFSPFRLVLPILECRIGILWYVFYIWLLSLSLMLVRLIHIIVCIFFLCYCWAVFHSMDKWFSSFILSPTGYFPGFGYHE